MNTPESTTNEHGRRNDPPRVNAAGKALLWLALVVFAFGPFPWW
jgi:hypothetical protein